MTFEPVSFIRLVEQGCSVKLTRLAGGFIKIKGASRLDDTARLALRRYKSVILPYLPSEEGS